MTDGHGSGLRARVRVLLRRRLATADERGFSLVEILITLTLLGMIVTSFMSALTLTVSSAARQQQVALAEGEARRAADYIQSQTYRTCGDTILADTTGAGIGLGYTDQLPATSFTGGGHQVLLSIPQFWVTTRDSAGGLVAGTDPNSQLVKIRDDDAPGTVSYAGASNPCNPWDCDANATTPDASCDFGLQKMTIRASVDNGAVVRDITLVKRKDGV